MPEIMPKLSETSRHLVEQLQQCIEESHGHEYDLPNSLAERGLVSQNLFKYLIRPGDVLVETTERKTLAYVTTDWVRKVGHKRKAILRHGAFMREKPGKNVCSPRKSSSKHF